MSTFALPADLALLVSELEHVLALNGHRAHQHAKYISEELQAKASTAAEWCTAPVCPPDVKASELAIGVLQADYRDDKDEGKLQLCSTAHTRR
jgi:hypothetical protein